MKRVIKMVTKVTAVFLVFYLGICLGIQKMLRDEVEDDEIEEQASVEKVKDDEWLARFEEC